MVAEVALGSHTHIATHTFPSLHPSVPPSPSTHPSVHPSIHPPARLSGCTYRYVHQTVYLQDDVGPCTSHVLPHTTGIRWTAALCRCLIISSAHPVATTDAYTLTAVSGPMGAPKSNHQTGYFEHPRLPRSWSCLLCSCLVSRTCCLPARWAGVCTSMYVYTGSYLFVQCFGDAWETHQSRTGSFQPCSHPARNQKTKQSTPYCHPGLQLRR